MGSLLMLGAGAVRNAAIGSFFGIGVVLVATAGPAWSQASGVVINNYRLSVQEWVQLGGDIPPGDYWYDSATGFWGHSGAPVMGQSVAGVRIGRLRADASAGTTGTYINGRELTSVEVRWLSRQVRVQRGRFWMNPEGVFGYEGSRQPLGQIILGGQPTGARRRSLSERGMLFRPGEILSGR